MVGPPMGRGRQTIPVQAANGSNGQTYNEEGADRPRMAALSREPAARRRRRPAHTEASRSVQLSPQMRP